MDDRNKQPQITVTDIVDRVPELDEIGPGVWICYYQVYKLVVIDSIVNNLDRIAHDTVLASSPLYLMLRRCQQWLPSAAAGWKEVASKLDAMRPGLGEYSLQIVQPKASWWMRSGPTEDISDVARLSEFLDDIDKSLQLLRLKHDALERQVSIPSSPPSCDAAVIKDE